MDYGMLTDNMGKKADFRSVILIMTSNAGASMLNRKLIGFDERINTTAIENEVERVFSPEFRNRLDAIVTFNAVNKEMAALIAKKAWDQLSQKLALRKVKLIASDELMRWIAQKGINNKYGAREIIRVVENDVKKLLINEVLFGKLSLGGTARLDINAEQIVLHAYLPSYEPDLRLDVPFEVF
jgi:ATP-dependent Clp protease ATP-binding subunit ClpA